MSASAFGPGALSLGSPRCRLAPLGLSLLRLDDDERASETAQDLDEDPDAGSAMLDVVSVDTAK